MKYQYMIAKFVSIPSLLRLACAASMTLGLASAANAANYYVSPKGNNTAGTSWSTAWNEFNQIKWATLKANDTLYLDGGQYTTPIIVPANVAPGVTILQSKEASHDGLISITYVGTSPIGIDIRGPITIRGNGKFLNERILGFLVHNFPTAGVRVATNASVNISGMSVASCPNGMLLQGVSIGTSVKNCIIFNCPTAGIRAQNIGCYPEVSRCWVYNTGYPSNVSGVGILMPEGRIQGCVLGPNLNYGVLSDCTGGQNGIRVSTSLLLNAFKANMRFVAPAGGPVVGLANNTSFCTPQNTFLEPHDNISAKVGQLPQVPGQIGQSLLGSTLTLFYGGNVRIPASAGKAYFDRYLNVQYKVTGNTTCLAGTQQDPKFIDQSIYSMPSTASFDTLVNTDFSVQNPDMNNFLGCGQPSIARFKALGFGW